MEPCNVTATSSAMPAPDNGVPAAVSLSKNDARDDTHHPQNGAPKNGDAAHVAAHGALLAGDAGSGWQPSADEVLTPPTLSYM